MGRALFSQTYSSPAVRTEPEPIMDPICQKWDVWNRFDPDSEEFFVDAEYEAFVDPGQLRLLDVEVVELALSSDNSSDSTDSGSSDAGSPMATGPDDPAVMIADAYPNFSAEQWGQRVEEPSSATSEWLSDFPRSTTQRLPTNIAVSADAETSRMASDEAGDITTTTRSYRPNRPRSASAASALIPLSALLTQTRSTRVHSEQVPIPLSPMVNLPLVDGPPSIPAVVPLYLPATPQRRDVRRPTQTMFSPSPPQSVTPRYYSWQTHSIPAVPTSPTTARDNRDGPLTNPHARRSFVRLGVQAPVLVSNTAN